MSKTPTATPTSGYTSGAYYQQLVTQSKSEDPAVKAAAIKELNDIDKEQYQSQYGPKSFDIGEFEGLLSRLEGSKMRQKRQESVEGRRGTMTQGLASMMTNFW